MTELIMLLCQRVALSGSVVAIVGGIYSFFEGVAHAASATAQGTTVNIGVAGIVGGLITAVGAVVVPPIMAYLKIKYDARILQLEMTVANLQEKAKKTDEAEAEAEEAKRQVAIYQERLRYLEGRVDENTSKVDRTQKTVETVKQVLRSDVLSGAGIQLAPIGSVVTDAFGRILTVSGQIEFITQFKPEELIGQNIRIIIPKPLHPDPINHADRSFNPNIDFDDRTIQKVEVRTKEGASIDVDIYLTRWFEKEHKGKIAGVRFGKLIRKHNPAATGLSDPFPPIDDLIPGIPHELARNSEVVAENTAKLEQTNEKLDTLISGQVGMANAQG